jgi:phage baseplate assembly protein W
MTISGLVGVTWPWTQGVPQFQYDDDVIYAAIVDIIFTALGERVMNTKHGSETIRLVFENKGPMMVALARREVGVALAQHLPLIKVLNVDVIEGEDDNDPVEVKVIYQYLGVRYDANVSVPTEDVAA